jgi:dTDP-4-amino-4,6-dideoxygalactose transaminase
MKEKERIPFTRPWLGEEETEALAKSLATGRIAGDGPESRRAASRIRELTGTHGALLTPSCTHALEMAVLILGLGPGDEVVTPSFSFVSAANAVMLRGAKVVFCEIDPDTLNLDPADLERRITDRTKAVIVVHYAGVAAPMDEIVAIAHHHGISVIEDAAQGIAARYKGHHLGTVGDIGCFSFHETKNITCAEGGAFVTDEVEYFRKAEIIREKGTDRSAFFRGEVEKYTWQSPGSSYLLADPLAALLNVQIDRLDEIQALREEIWSFYRDSLSDLEEQGILRLPRIPKYAEPNWHIFYVLLRSGGQRDRVLKRLNERGIGATFHFVPLHTSPFATKNLGYQEGDFPVTERACEMLLRLPLYPQLTEGQRQRVVEEFRSAVTGSE